MSPLGHIQWGLGLPQLQATGGAFVVLTPLPPALSWVHSTWGWKEWNLRLQVGGECARIVQSSGQKWQELGVWGAGNLGPHPMQTPQEHVPLFLFSQGCWNLSQLSFLPISTELVFYSVLTQRKKRAFIGVWIFKFTRVPWWGGEGCLDAPLQITCSSLPCCWGLGFEQGEFSFYRI